MAGNRLSNWLQSSPTIKFVVIAVLALVLMIPTALVKDLVQERQQRQFEVQQEISQLWGGDQTLEGPIVSVPYSWTRTNDEGKVLRYTGILHFLPELLDATGEITPVERHRGLYKGVVYSSN